MLRQPAQPAPEGTAVFVDGDDAGAGRAVEGSVGEDEAEGGEGFDEGAGLGAEDIAVDAAAVETEYARVVEGWVWWCRRRRHGLVMGPGGGGGGVEGGGKSWSGDDGASLSCKEGPG